MDQHLGLSVFLTVLHDVSMRIKKNGAPELVKYSLAHKSLLSSTFYFMSTLTASFFCRTVSALKFIPAQILLICGFVMVEPAAKKTVEIFVKKY